MRPYVRFLFLTRGHASRHNPESRRERPRLTVFYKGSVKFLSGGAPVQSLFGENRVTEQAPALCVRACSGPKTAHSFREQALTLSLSWSENRSHFSGTGWPDCSRRRGPDGRVQPRHFPCDRFIPSGVDNDLFHGSGFAPRVGAARSAMRGIGQVSRRPPRGKGAPPKAAFWAALAASRAACGAPHHGATRS